MQAHSADCKQMKSNAAGCRVDYYDYYYCFFLDLISHTHTQTDRQTIIFAIFHFVFVFLSY